MAQQSRTERLAAEHDTLLALKSASTIFDFESEGENPDRYTVIFHGKGIRRSTDADESIEFVNLHRCELRLPYSFPERPPDIRWLTPVFHPNVSFSGFIELEEIGLPWDTEFNLDVVCERLWDVARLAYVNLEDSKNYAAQSWFRDECNLELPVDHRPLRDAATPSQSNVIRYRRREETDGDQPPVLDPPGRHTSDVFYIGDDTPTPRMPRRSPRSRPEDDDIFYIGDE